MYFFPLAFVAPCLNPSPHVHFPTIIPHQIPMYLEGLIHDTSPSLLGGLQFSVRCEAIKSRAVSVILIVRQGVLKGMARRTLSPLDHGAKSQ